MSDAYKPTCQLRLVERDRYNLRHDCLDKVEVLQQLWTSDYVGERDEWRDIEVAKE